MFKFLSHILPIRWLLSIIRKGVFHVKSHPLSISGYSLPDIPKSISKHIVARKRRSSLQLGNIWLTQTSAFYILWGTKIYHYRLWPMSSLRWYKIIQIMPARGGTVHTVANILVQDAQAVVISCNRNYRYFNRMEQPRKITYLLALKYAIAIP